MKKIAIIFLAFFLFVLPCRAALAQDVNVNAIVPSKISVPNSSITLNVANILADLSQKAMISVKLNDDSGKPLKDIPITIVSNRGQIDWLRPSTVDAQILSLEAGIPVAKTDDDSYAYFLVASNVPGKALLTVTADTLVKFNPIEITFLPLPFPTNVTVSVEVPSFVNQDKKITLFKPSGSDSVDMEKLVNLGVEIIVPFWLVVLAVSLLATTPLLFIVIIALLGRIKKYEKYDKLCLEREEKLLQEEVAEMKMQQEEIKKEEVEIEKEAKLLEEIVDKKIDKN